MFKHILVAVDDSKTSLKALEKAGQLAKALSSAVTLIHVVDLTLPSFDAGFVWMDMEKALDSHRKAAAAFLEKMEKKIQSLHIPVKGQLIENLDQSRISNKIIEFIDQSKADLLVLGTHGRRGFHRFLLGSVAEEVTRMAQTPTLLIRGEPDDD